MKVLSNNHNNRLVNFSSVIKYDLKENSDSNPKPVIQNKSGDIPVAFYGKDLVYDSKNFEDIPQELKILFESIKNKEGKEFANAAYKGLLKYYKIDDIAPSEIEWDNTCKTCKMDTVSDYAWYKNKVILYEDIFLN